MPKNKLAVILAGIFLYISSTGISYLIFAQNAVKRPSVPLVQEGERGRFVIDASIPRTEECPLNGKLHTEQEKDIWETRRPLAIMMNNHVEARPQSGISFADIVYEAVAEGGITRFMPIFHCGSSAFDLPVAPVRSARTYFLDWVSEYDALYNHVGGAGRCSDDTVDERAKALCQIGEYGIKDLDQFSISFPDCFRNYDRLDHEVDSEHTMVCFTDKLHDIASAKDWTDVDEDGISWDKNFVSWKFADDADESDRGTVTSISFTFWDDFESDFGVQWDYDAVDNSYKRLTGGDEHLDLETEEQLSAKNIVVQFVRETVLDDALAHLLYETIGTGKALVFQNGEAVSGTWSKASRTARTKFFDSNGSEIKFVRGQIWIEAVPTGTEVTY